MKWQSACVLSIAFALAAGAHAQAANQDVREFVRSASFPTSYEELTRSYDATVAPQLAALLNSKEEEANWTRIAGLLGAVGGEQSADALIAFVEKPVEGQRLSADHENAYRQSIMSLGLLVNRTGSQRALKYLVDGLTPSVWIQRGVQGIALWASSYDEYYRELSKYAVFGLALSGDSRAGDALRAFKQSPTAGQAQFRTGMDDTLTQWLEVHQLVAERGVAGMYGYYEAKRQVQAQKDAEETKRLVAERAQQQQLRESQRPVLTDGQLVPRNVLD